MNEPADGYGNVTLPESARWGKNTARSLKNFPIGTETMPEAMIRAIVILKRSAALVNGRYHEIEEEAALAIVECCDAILARYDASLFPLSLWQTGSATQTNMNVNEVIALACQERHESLTIHPNDDVNHSQSSNDVIPSAMSIMAYQMSTDLLAAVDRVIETLVELQRKHEGYLKVGRTHYQDATPMLVTQEIQGWIGSFQSARAMIKDSMVYFLDLAIGGTAVGTGLNSVEGFAQDVAKEVENYTGIAFTASSNPFHALSSKDCFVNASGALNALAVNAMKLANDLRFLSSGPRAGIHEVSLPSNEAGSSIMPGKVNPTQCEALVMIAVQVMGNHQSITVGASQSHLQLNTMMPLILYNHWQSLRLLADGLESFNSRCLRGVSYLQPINQTKIESSLMSATFLNPLFGYDRVAQWVKKADEQNVSIQHVLLEEKVLSEERIRELFDYQEMTHPTLRKRNK